MSEKSDNRFEVALGGSRSGIDSIYQAKIMLVDDEPINMEVLMAHLEDEGYSNFVSTSDSVGAFAMIGEVQPDVLLLDLMMPDVTGFDILTLLRQHDSLKHLPVVVLTSSDDSATKLTALQLGATDFLSKPVDASELALRLRNTLAARAYQYQLTHYDALTGLPNRYLFLRKLKFSLERHEQSDAQAALVMVNISRFKSINDTFGRETGDTVLYEFALRLQDQFGHSPKQTTQGTEQIQRAVFRLEGDKFVIILPNFACEQDLASTLEASLSALSEKYSVDGQEIYLRVGMGVSVFPQDGVSGEELETHAETALQHAKNQAASSYTFFCSGMDEQARKYLEIEAGLRVAVEKNQFFVMYQPKVDVMTNVIIGAEALVRWHHPEHGIIPPDQFIPLAEESGQIIEIGTWVMRESLKQCCEWQRKGKDRLKIAVNVSIRQMLEPDFLEVVKSVISESGIDPKLVVIELTENMIMDNAEANVSILNKLKEIGVLLSIDDFGTGYSSLSYLQKFPVDELKIDKSFLMEIQSPLDKAPIVKAVASLAHDLGMSLVAEGVETIHQLARIKALKCQVYQGYLCSPPLPADGFEKLLFADVEEDDQQIGLRPTVRKAS